MNTSQRIAGFCVGSLLAASQASQAQVQRSGGGETQKFMQQYQQLAAEKTALQAQVAQMKAELDGTKAELAATKKDRDVLKAHAAAGASEGVTVVRLTAARDTAEKSLELYKQRLNELIARFRETNSNLKQVETERSSVRKSWRKAASRSISAPMTICSSSRSQTKCLTDTSTSDYSTKLAW